MLNTLTRRETIPIDQLALSDASSPELVEVHDHAAASVTQEIRMPSAAALCQPGKFVRQGDVYLHWTCDVPSAGAEVDPAAIVAVLRRLGERAGNPLQSLLQLDAAYSVRKPGTWQLASGNTVGASHCVSPTGDENSVLLLWPAASDAGTVQGPLIVARDTFRLTHGHVPGQGHATVVVPPGVYLTTFQVDGHRAARAAD